MKFKIKTEETLQKLEKKEQLEPLPAFLKKSGNHVIISKGFIRYQDVTKEFKSYIESVNKKTGFLPGFLERTTGGEKIYIEADSGDDVTDYWKSWVEMTSV